MKLIATHHVTKTLKEAGVKNLSLLAEQEGGTAF
jgi:hypothetical protein